jgi:acyl carrier protein
LTILFWACRIIEANKGGKKNMVFEKVRAILVDQLGIDDEEKITMEASITDDLGADSLDVVDLIMSLEEEFDIEIPDEDVENMKTVGDIVKYVESKLS